MSSNVHPLIQLLRNDRRYKIEAYEFVREALSYAQDVLSMGRSDESEEISHEKRGSETGPEKPKREEPDRHLTGQQLCEAIRVFALEQFGLLAKVVLESWGLHSTSDFGNVVFNMIDIGLMKKSKSDRREDFDNVYNFDEAFVRGFRINVMR
jgi:uncharacterized repeat protein (TIGR04138 family)